MTVDDCLLCHCLAARRLKVGACIMVTLPRGLVPRGFFYLVVALRRGSRGVTAGPFFWGAWAKSKGAPVGLPPCLKKDPPDF